MSDSPLVSIIIPAYHSGRTIEASLRSMLAQTYPNLQLVVIDSGPDEAVRQIVAEHFPQIVYERAARRLPHAARNRGVELAGGDLLLFSDPDVYAQADWVENLVAVYNTCGGVIIGSVTCYGDAWFDNGVHLCKFDDWLPGGEIRPLEVGPTVGMLCDRDALAKVGGFRGDFMIADTLICWAFSAAGIPIHFAPRARVAHHHLLNGWGPYLRERFERGREFGWLRLERCPWPAWRVLLHLAVSTLLPLRLIRLTWRGLQNAHRAGMPARSLGVFPIVVGGQAAWLAGEAAVYLRWLAGRREPA